MSAQITAEEMLESLTGFDEIAIKQQFGAEVADLANNQPTMFLRSLVAVHVKRQDGLPDAAAKQRAMELTLKQAQEYFLQSEGEDGSEDFAVTAEGEGVATSA